MVDLLINQVDQLLVVNETERRFDRSCDLLTHLLSTGSLRNRNGSLGVAAISDETPIEPESSLPPGLLLFDLLRNFDHDHLIIGDPRFQLDSVLTSLLCGDCGLNRNRSLDNLLTADGSGGVHLLRRTC